MSRSGRQSSSMKHTLGPFEGALDSHAVEAPHFFLNKLLQKRVRFSHVHWLLACRIEQKALDQSKDFAVLTEPVNAPARLRIGLLEKSTTNRSERHQQRHVTVKPVLL